MLIPDLGSFSTLIIFIAVVLAEATRNEAFNVNVPLLDTSLSKVLSIGKVLTEKMFVFFVEVEAFEKRGEESFFQRNKEH